MMSPLLEQDEIIGTIKRLKKRKAPGIDGI